MAKKASQQSATLFSFPGLAAVCRHRRHTHRCYRKSLGHAICQHHGAHRCRQQARMRPRYLCNECLSSGVQTAPLVRPVVSQGLFSENHVRCHAHATPHQCRCHSTPPPYAIACHGICHGLPRHMPWHATTMPRYGNKKCWLLGFGYYHARQ